MPSRRYLSACLAALLLCTLLLPLHVAADTVDDGADFLSREGIGLFLLAGTAQPLLTDGADGKTEAFRTADALTMSLLATEVLKMTIHETRPDETTEDSFPSGHTALAFSAATAASHFHPEQAPYWYAGAALIGWSRVQLDRHYIHDVLAGAALGYLTTRWTLSQPRGVLLTPFIDADTESTDFQAFTNSPLTHPRGVLFTPLIDAATGSTGLQATTTF